MDRACERRLRIYEKHLSTSANSQGLRVVTNSTESSESVNPERQEQAMYDINLLRELDWESRKAKFKNGISPLNPGQNLVMRPLQLGDYDSGYLQLLTQLTKVGDISREAYNERFESMRKCTGTYFITVLEDKSIAQIIGAATLVIEQKYIHSASLRGRIEDVVVSDLYRGKQLGKLLVETLNLLGKHLGCYKMSLECSDDNVPFYETLGYKNDNQNFMIIRYKD